MSEAASAAMQLPRNWVAAPLSDILLETTQRVPSAPFTYVDIGSIGPGGTISSGQPLEPEAAPSRARKEIQYGDTIFATVRPYLRNIAFIPPTLDGQICSTGFCVLRPNQTAADPRFVYWLACSESLMSQVIPKMRGVSYPAASDWEVKEALVPVPPLGEQQRIVEALETLLSDLDAAVRTLETAFEKLKRYRQAVLKAAVEGELSREWREAHRHHIEPASDLLIRILTDRRKRDDTRGREPNTETGNPGGWKRSYREPVGPVPSYELDTPAGWRWASFDQVAYSIRSGTPATSRRDDTPYIRYSGRAQSEKGRWISAM